MTAGQAPAARAASREFESRTSDIQCWRAPQDDVLAVGQQFVGVGHSLVLLSSGTGVRPRVDLLDPLPGQMRVQLRRGDAGVAEQFLHDAQVRPALQQVCRKSYAAACGA